jgi:hypothetical protein
MGQNYFDLLLQGGGEFFRRDAGHFQRTPQRAKGNFPVQGDDATAFAIGGDFFEDDMLPRWRSTKNPSRFKAFTASMPETMGSLAMR